MLGAGCCFSHLPPTTYHLQVGAWGFGVRGRHEDSAGAVELGGFRRSALQGGRFWFPLSARLDRTSMKCCPAEAGPYEKRSLWPPPLFRVLFLLPRSWLCVRAGGGAVRTQVAFDVSPHRFRCICSNLIAQCPETLVCS